MNASTHDALLILIPIAIVVVCAVFRLDEVILKTRASQIVKRARPRFANYDEDARTLLADPDGQVSGPRGEEIGFRGQELRSWRSSRADRYKPTKTSPPAH